MQIRPWEIYWHAVGALSNQETKQHFCKSEVLPLVPVVKDVASYCNRRQQPTVRLSVFVLKKGTGQSVRLSMVFKWIDRSMFDITGILLYS